MVYRQTSRTEARKVEMRQRLLDAARGLVADGGFRNLRIDTLATVAGIATGTVYRYFPSKADLSVEIYRHVCNREVQVTGEIADTDGAARERLSDAVRAFSTRAMRARKVAYALIAEPTDPAIDAERIVYRRSLARAFERIIADGIADQSLPRQNAQLSAACLVGALLEALVSPLSPVAEGPADEEEAVLDEIIALCRRAVGDAG